MLLVCPECRTKYVVPDSAIGTSGRQVRCANCRHSWFQDGVASPPTPPVPPIVAPPVVAQPDSSPAADFASISDEPSPGFSAFDGPPRAVVDADRPSRFGQGDPPVAELAREIPPPPRVSENRSQFAHEPPFRPRRNPAKMMTWAAAAFALLAVSIGMATWYFGWLDNSFATSAEEPDLTIVLHDNLELGRDADGSPFFIASGSIVNPTATAQNVPELLVTLKDDSGRSVYSWTMKAPVRTLAPGAKTDFSQLRRDVPLAASRISVSWALGSS